MVLSKKIFFISSLFLLITLLIWGAYYLSFKKPAEQLNANTAETQAKNSAAKEINNLPAAKISIVSEDPVLFPIYAADGDLLKYYLKSDGRAYQSDLNGGNRKLIFNENLIGLSGVAWSPDRTKAIVKIAETNGKFRFYFYDFANKKEVALKDNMDSVAWQNNAKIIYKYYDAAAKKRSLNIANPDGSGWNKIADVDFRDISITPVPKTGLVSFWNTPDAYTETSFQTISPIGTLGNTLSTGLFGADYLWNVNGTKVLISYVDKKGGSKMELAVADDRGENFKNLEIPALVSKTIWSKDNQTVYYALPGSIPETAVMPNDYISSKFNTTDIFWKADVSTGKKSRMVDLKEIPAGLDATNLFFNADESFLFFVNRADGKLYRISL